MDLQNVTNLSVKTKENYRTQIQALGPDIVDGFILLVVNQYHALLSLRLLSNAISSLQGI